MLFHGPSPMPEVRTRSPGQRSILACSQTSHPATDRTWDLTGPMRAAFWPLPRYKAGHADAPGDEPETLTSALAAGVLNLVQPERDLLARRNEEMEERKARQADGFALLNVSPRQSIGSSIPMQRA